MDGDSGSQQNNTPHEPGTVEPTVARLVHEHYERLYRYAWRLSGGAADAEDLVQQTFLTAHRKLDQLRDSDHARSWLFTILRNVYFKSLQRQSDVVQVSLDAVVEPSQSGDEQRFVDREHLQVALNEMPEEFRTPVILFYFEEFTYKQIAEQIGVPLGTVMSRLSRGRAHLRQVIEESEVRSGSRTNGDST